MNPKKIAGYEYEFADESHGLKARGTGYLRVNPCGRNRWAWYDLVTILRLHEASWAIAIAAADAHGQRVRFPMLAECDSDDAFSVCAMINHWLACWKYVGPGAPATESEE